MSYHRIAATASARAVVEQHDRERAAEAKRAMARTEHWRDWLQHYRTQPRPTRFDWRPSLPAIKPVVTPINPQETTNGKEIIEGEFTVVADADAPRDAGGQEGPPIGRDPAASEGSGAAPWQALEDTPF